MRLVTQVCLAAVVNVSALNVYHIGNSLTDQATGIIGVAISMGEEHGQRWHTIPGAPLPTLWSNKGTDVVDDLTNRSWDAVVMQTRLCSLDDDMEAATGFMQLAWQGNPDCQAYFFQEYPYPRDTDPGNPLPGFESVFLDPNPGIEAEDFWAHGAGNSRAVAEARAAAFTARFPDKKPALIVPVGEVLYEIVKRLQQGQTWPGLSVYKDLEREGDENGDHFNDYGMYIVALTHYATVYAKSPVGAGCTDIRTGYYDWHRKYSVDTTFAAAMQQIVWQAVSGYPYAGVTATAIDRHQFTVRSATAADDERIAAGFWTLDGRSFGTRRTPSTTSAVVDLRKGVRMLLSR